MEWRKPKAEDLDLFLRVHPEMLGTEAVLSGQADRIWRKLLTAPAFQGAVVTRGKKGGGSAESVTGVGASVFVDDAFAEGELRNPQPGMNGRLVQSQLGPDSLAFNRDKIAEANSAGGVNVVVLAGRWHPGLTNEEDIKEARFLLATGFSEVHAGYRFKRMMIELIDERDREWASAIPYMRLREVFPGSTRALGIVEKSSLEKNDATVLAQHFSCPLPKLFLRASDQELLLAALENPTDEWLTRELGLTKEAVKRRWSALFERVDREMPDLLASIKSIDRRVRGPQKRHFVLAYVRRHPQELRPFARVRAANGS